MMFGAVPLAFKGTTTKIHTVRSPYQVLITKLFGISPTSFTDPLEGVLSPKSPRSRSQTIGSSSSVPVATPKTPEDRSKKLLKEEEEEAVRKLSQPNSLGKHQSSPIEESLLDSNDDARSLHSPFSSSYTNRRFVRHRSTSIERGQYVPSQLQNSLRDEIEGSQHRGRLIFSLGSRLIFPRQLGLCH